MKQTVFIFISNILHQNRLILLILLKQELKKDCIYLIKNTVKTVIFWHFIFYFNIISNLIYCHDDNADFIYNISFFIIFHLYSCMVQ